ncbi:hypothetical protein ES703_81491 [subsurface metagenome]
MNKKWLVLIPVLAVLAFLFYLSPPVTAITAAFSDDGVERSMATRTEATLNDIWGSPSFDVFAVGEGGTIAHYDGSEWSKMDSGVKEEFPNDLYCVWGTSASDVFAGGQVILVGKILHYDGGTWSPVWTWTLAKSTQQSLNDILGRSIKDIWGSSSSDVFAVGEDNVIVHYDGNTWSIMTNSVIESLEDRWGCSSLEGIWGSSSSNVFAVGGSGVILHYDGSTWSLGTPSLQRQADIYERQADIHMVVSGIMGLGDNYFCGFALD